MAEPLSPAAQAVLDAAYALPIRNGQPSIAAAFRAIAKNWAAEIQQQPRNEFISGIKNCIDALNELANDLEVSMTKSKLEPKRFDIKSLLKDPVTGKELTDGAVDFICKVEGIRD